MESTGPTVEELAKEGKKHAYSKLPAIPMAAMIIILISAALMAVCAPMGVIFVNGSQSVVKDLSDMVMQDTVAAVAKDVNFLRLRSESLVKIVGKNKVIQKVLTTQFWDLEHQPEAVNIMQTLLMEDQDFTHMICITRRDLAGIGNDPSTWPAGTAHNNFTALLIGTVYGSTRPYINYSNIFVDYRSNSGKRYFLDINSPGDINPAMPDTIIYETVSTLGKQPPAVLLNLPNPTNLTMYYPTVFNGMSGLLTIRNIWTSNSTGAQPAYFCATVARLFETEQIFINSKPTPNSQVILYDAKNGRLLISSVPETSFKSLTTGERYLFVESPDPRISNVGLAVQALYGNVTQVPINAEQLLTASYDINGEPWFITTRYFTALPYNWIMVVAIPRRDFFARIDSSQKTGTIVAAVVAVGGALLVSMAAFAALRPLHALSTSMKQLTKFDFSSLEGGILDNRSFVREIRNLQETFSAMVNAFSVSIRKNRALMAGNSTTQKSN
ncbi:hypothetical protein HK104_001606 [Borealophlyctis nickersoniae]|nr:hypothetical protein HK104_001606 [Borealophlyctis nickersoniae]